MELVLALTVGILYAAGLYLLLRRSLVKVIVGLALLTNGANLLIFTAAGLVRGRPPLIEGAESVPVAPFADPVPQALILTAIVIGFGLQAFAMALAYRVYRESGSEDIDSLRTTEDPSVSLPKVEAGG
jgi:multicomponent Na+:H+ antiporter subunit C